LSGFETVNLFSGSLNFRLPLLQVGGVRGAAAYTMMLPIQQLWHAEQAVTCEGTSCSVQYEYPVSTGWNSFPDPYGPGRLDYRYDNPSHMSACGGALPAEAYQALTRLTFTGPDGTEYELRDDLTNGKPAAITAGDQCSGLNASAGSRGKNFSTHDGSAVRFVSDLAVNDEWQAGAVSNSTTPPTGNLLFPNGALYRVVCGQVVSIRDRNGNLTTFRYENSWSYNSTSGACTLTGNLQGRVTQIYDSTGRQIVISYGESPGNIGTDIIEFTGYSGTWRTIQVQWNNLGDTTVLGNQHVLRNDYTGVKRVYPDLFPQFVQVAPNPFNPAVISLVTLPNGQKYQLQYNPYGELARIVLPTGGAFEYDWGSGYTNSTADSGAVDGSPKVGIYRRVLTRRVFDKGGTSPLLTDAFTASTTSGTSIASPNEGIYSYEASTTVTVQHNGGALGYETHYFNGDPGVLTNLADSLPRQYLPWSDGREIQTDSSGFRSEFQSLNQGGATSWWSTTGCLLITSDPNYPCTTATMPPENPHAYQIDTELLDSDATHNKIFSRRTLAYDAYNNVTDAYDYDYANIPAQGPVSAGSAGSLLRHSHTAYVWPTTSGYIAGSTFFFPRLISSETVDGGGSALASTAYEYDVYQPLNQNDTEHAAMSTLSGIIQMDPTYSNAGVTLRGNITGITKGLGPDATTTSIQHDVAGNVTAVIDGKGNKTTYDRDPNSYTSPAPTAPLVPAVNPLPNPPSGSTYGFLTKITNPANHHTSMSWDLDIAKPVSITDPNSKMTSAQYGDLLDRLKYVGHPDGGSDTYTYTDASNQVTTATALAYTSTAGTQNCTGQTIATDIIYDGLGRKIQQIHHDADGLVTIATTYDGLSRVATITDPYFGSNPVNTTTTIYDSLGRVLQTQTSTDLAKTNSAYVTNTTTVRDAAGKWKQSQSDALGRLTSVTEDPTASLTPPGGTLISNAPVAPAVSLDNYVTNYGYDALGDLLSVTQGVQSRTFAYDSLQRLTCAANPESRVGATSCLGTLPTSGADLYTYDANGNLHTHTDPRGVLTTNGYDALNRLLSKSYSGEAAGYSTPPVSYTWDTIFKGALTSVANSVSTTSYDSYDAMGRPTQITQTPSNQSGYIFKYAYNTAGGLEQTTYPSGRAITSCSDSGNHIARVFGSTGTNYAGDSGTRISYFANGSLNQMKLGNLLVETWLLNHRSQPQSMTLVPPTGSALRTLTFDYGTTTNNGNLLSQSISGSGISGTLNQIYTYDELNRLGSVNENAGAATVWGCSFGYDRYGNQWTTGSTCPSSTSFTSQGPTNYDTATNHILTNGSVVGTGGDLTNVGGYVYRYDAEHRLVRSSLNSPTAYYYDGDGRRVAKVDCTSKAVTDPCDVATPGGQITQYAYDATGDLAAEFSNVASGVNGTQYLTDDHLGSTRVVTDGTGGIIPGGCHDYLPFGEEILAGLDGRGGCFGNTYASGVLFTSKERDAETGLDYFGARYFSGAQGRFTTADWSASPEAVPYASLSDPQSLNLYSYVQNNPLSRTDPDGHCSPTMPLPCIAAAAGEGAIGGPYGLVVGVFVGLIELAVALDDGQPAGAHPVCQTCYTKDDWMRFMRNHPEIYASDARPGTRGKPDHQQTVEEEAKRINGDPEVPIETPLGKKGSRRADAVGTNPETGAPEIVQVIRPTPAGNVPKREKDAAADIHTATGVKPTLVPVRPVTPLPKAPVLNPGPPKPAKPIDNK
jgi:RHS repeat-associated protein